VKVRCDEGIAIHIGPEPCVVVREGTGEASAGEGTGQPLSRDRKIVPGADAVTWSGRRYGRARHRERPDGPAWSDTLACVDAPCSGTLYLHACRPTTVDLTVPKASSKLDEILEHQRVASLDQSAALGDPAYLDGGESERFGECCNGSTGCFIIA
jgi:hypothetical protein